MVLGAWSMVDQMKSSWYNLKTSCQSIFHWVNIRLRWGALESAEKAQMRATRALTYAVRRWRKGHVYTHSRKMSKYISLSKYSVKTRRAWERWESANARYESADIRCKALEEGACVCIIGRCQSVFHWVNIRLRWGALESAEKAQMRATRALTYSVRRWRKEAISCMCMHNRKMSKYISQSEY